MLRAMKLCLLLLVGSPPSSDCHVFHERSTDVEEYGFSVSTGKSAVSSGKSAIHFLDPSTKLSGPPEGGLRGRPAVSDEIFGEGRHNQEGRDLQAIADVEVVNNCGFDAYIGIVYSAVVSDRWYRWPLVQDGESVVLNGVIFPTIYIYGVTSDSFATVWDSDSSPHCFEPGDCLSARNVGSLQRGSTTYYICGTNEPTMPPTPRAALIMPPTPRPAPTMPPTPRPAPTKPPTPRAAVVMPSIDTQWLDGHNARRTNFYAQYGLSPMNLKWSPALKTSARNYARKLLQIGGTAACSIEHGYLGDSYGGENLAAVWGSGPFTNPLTPDNVLSAWYDDEIGLPYGQKGHATQVVFRSTRYVGCAGASKTLDSGGSCYIQVCRYISPGNCNMDSGNWLQRTLEDTSLCDPECPPDGCL